MVAQLVAHGTLLDDESETNAKRLTGLPTAIIGADAVCTLTVGTWFAGDEGCICSPEPHCFYSNEMKCITKGQLQVRGYKIGKLFYLSDESNLSCRFAQIQKAYLSRVMTFVLPSRWRVPIWSPDSHLRMMPFVLEGAWLAVLRLEGQQRTRRSCRQGDAVGQCWISRLRRMMEVLGASTAVPIRVM